MTFDLQPVLTGNLVNLRPLRADDHDALLAAAADPLIWEQHPDSDRHEPEAFRGFFDGAMASGGAFAVVDAGTGAIIGSSRYCGLDPEGGQVEIGWTFLARSHWGGPCNAEMKMLMLRHAYRFVRSVVFLVGEDNMRSRRAVEKLGAVPDGTTTDDSGDLHIVYRLTREQFESA